MNFPIAMPTAAPVRRYLHDALSQALQDKIVLLTGPRQCGKTTLSKMLDSDHQYINHDLAEHRLLLRDKSWDRQRRLIIFDELHKMKDWKAWLKGVYDVEGLPPALLATGSARMNIFRRTGDSLAGRYLLFRLHPLDVQEAVEHHDLGADEALRRLMTVGGFPEPFLRDSRPYYNRWKRSHTDAILREDLISLTAVRDIQSIETLIELLRQRVGSPISIRALAGDLQKSPTTVRNWLDLLEDMYVLFRITPWHRNVARALLKASKFYFYDNAMVVGEPGVRLENLMACALRKAVHRAADVDGDTLSLHFVRNKEGREIDFLIAREQTPVHLIETKQGDATPSKSLRYFFADQPIHRTQVVGDLPQAQSFPDGVRVEPAAPFLAGLYPENLLR